MQSSEPIIYVAGNPELYPLEYYDSDSQSYQGAIPGFLERFAQEYGYDLRYYQPGSEDRRERLASNLQVDLISGCEAGEHYENTQGEAVVLFSAETEGEERAYLLRFTQTAPAQFQTDLRSFAARTGQETWTGAVLEAVRETPPAQTPAGAVIAGAAACLALLAGAILALWRIRKHRRAAETADKTDPETGLECCEQLEAQYSRLLRDQARPLYCLICFHLDLDHIGYLGGREQSAAFLLHGARMLREAAEPGDLLARGSGGDLVALKRAPSLESAEVWTRSRLEEIRSFSLAGGKLGPGDVTAGICPLESEYRDLEQVMFHARQCAMAARWEESEYRLCGTEQCSACRDRWQLLADFREGLRRGDFQLWLQFFVDAAAFRVVGGEALSRWNHPQKGLLSPDRYIPLMEEEGWLDELDFYGMEKTCAFLEELDKQQVRDFFISCNFSRKTFSAPDFVERCAQVIGQYSFTRKLLILEVTESKQVGQREAERMLQNIVGVRKLGVRVIFDDFGMGFSSFHDLQEYPVDGLKLDKQLVDNMETERGRIILGALVETGHRMGMTILAEGVEHDRQIELLKELRCDVLQGFRFSVPLPAAEAQAQILGGDRTRDRRQSGPGSDETSCAGAAEGLR